MGSGFNNKINELCKPKDVKKRRNTRLEKCYVHINIATALFVTEKEINLIGSYKALNMTYLV